eukprot:g2475.t1
MSVKVWDAGSGSEVLSVSASDRQALARSSTGALTACNESALQVSGASIQLLQQTVGSSGPAEVASMALAEKVKIGDAEALLDTEIRALVNKETKQRVLHAGQLKLPHEVEQHVQCIFGLHGFPLPPTKSYNIGVADDAAPIVTPAVIKAAYQVEGVRPTGSDRNRQAVAEFQGQTVNVTDLTQFFRMFVSGNASSTDSTISKFVGTTPATGSGGVEANLDIQYIMGVAPGVQTEFWYFGGRDFCGDLKGWTGKILDTESPPLVHSVSYGWQGELSTIGCAPAMVSDIDADFAKLAARGISIIFASGDSGAGYQHVSPPRPLQCGAGVPVQKDVMLTRHIAGYSKDCPSVAACCSIANTLGGSDWTYEPNITYCRVFRAPQLPPAALYNESGRATPDVAALGEGFQVFVNGEVKTVGGTSASAPLFAGLVSLLNEARTQKGRPPMGFLNPWLYAHQDTLTDIVDGSNAISRSGTAAPYGFNCTKGYDPVTGLGTPAFTKMLAAALSAPAAISSTP